jgi:ferredoxin
MSNWLERMRQPSAVGAEADNGVIHLGRVAADATRCVQCGVCGYNCPVGIDVRSYARRGLLVDDASCITCGNCINVCPRGTLRWETGETS